MHPSKPQPKAAIRSLLSYRPSFGEAKQGQLIRLSANEGALGVSPNVQKVLQPNGMTPHRYPEVQDQHLNAAISERYGLDASRIISSNGSDELISLITIAYLEPGDEVVMSQYAFGDPTGNPHRRRHSCEG